MSHIFYYKSKFQKYQSNAQPTVIENEIQVKKEQTVEQILGIKTEKKSPKESSSSSKKGASVPIESSAWVMEKKALVAKIVGLQTENQRIVFDLQNKICQHEAIIKEKVNVEQNLSEKIFNLTEELKKTRSEAAIMQSNLNDQKDRDKDTISQLTYENKKLTARINQLQTGINQQESEQKENTDNVYEVESLIRHKKKKNGMHYLVRWKNYTSEYDTWEKEENLMCPKILESYKQKMNL